MARRLFGALSLALVLLTGAAVPAGAAGSLSALDLRQIPGDVVCDSPIGFVVVQVKSDSSRLFTGASYSLAADSHSFMDIGSGYVAVVAAAHHDADGTLVSSAERRTRSRVTRYDCYANTNAGTSHTAEVVYLRPPTRPTVEQVRAFCESASIGEEWCPLHWAG